ncbi:hypothetical protein DH2020_002664 [Rehmannia glutinosa]|uniref:SOSEKI DIX-like domain-containing protein n=1 Tax=Rehmannia glutinosa TaxID=99300 RepID=A0ABR0XUS2_REHGL
MPESFSWSYKRRYKTGYVWQDLLDDDLINPISDNEYVLKGSDISSSTIKGKLETSFPYTTDYSYTEEKVGKQKDEFLQEDLKTPCKEENHSHSSETSMYISTKSSSEIEEEYSPTFGSETSTVTDDSAKAHKLENKSTSEEKTPSDDKIDRSSPFYSTLLSKKNKKRSNKVSTNDENPKNSSSSADEPNLTKSKSYSNGASNVFRNLMSCGALDTNDSAVVPINKQSNNNKPNSSLLNMCSSDLKNVNSAAEICKRDHRVGGSQRIYGTPRKSFDGVKDSVKNKSDLRDQKAPCAAAYKPVNGPICSQCGKPFKPEKLHSHMKSCKGMKAMSKAGAANSAAVDKASKGSIESQNGDSLSGHLLTH